MERELEAQIIIDEKEREIQQAKEKFHEARKHNYIQNERWKKQGEKT